MRREISSFYRGFLESRLACPSVRDGTPRRAGWAAIGATEVTDALEPDGGGCARRWRLTYCRTSSRLERAERRTMTRVHTEPGPLASSWARMIGKRVTLFPDEVAEGVRQGDPDAVGAVYVALADRLLGYLVARSCTRATR